MHFGCGCTSEAVLHSLFRSLATPSSVHRSRTSEAVPPLAVLRWDFSSLAALVDMSMPSWLEPSPGTRGNKPTPATDDVRVAAAYSAAGAAAEAAQAAADLLMGSRRTPRKKSRTTSPASTQKGTLKSNSGLTRSTPSRSTWFRVQKQVHFAQRPLSTTPLQLAWSRTQQTSAFTVQGLLLAQQPPAFTVRGLLPERDTTPQGDRQEPSKASVHQRIQ